MRERKRNLCPILIRQVAGLTNETPWLQIKLLSGVLRVDIRLMTLKERSVCVCVCACVCLCVSVCVFPETWADEFKKDGASEGPCYQSDETQWATTPHLLVINGVFMCGCL